MGLSWLLGRFAPVLRRLPGKRSQVASGDAPTPETMAAILDLLDRCLAKAPFPLSGYRTERRLIAEPRLDGAIALMHDQAINERPGAQFRAGVTITLTRVWREAITARNLRAVTLKPVTEAPFW